MIKFVVYILIYFKFSVICLPLPHGYQIQCYSNIPEVQRLQEYLRIDTSQPENLDASTRFWRRQAINVGLRFSIYRPAGLPICVLTWLGTNPKLPSILLNSHADVVSVDEASWSHPPFSALIDEKGDIYARGAQDTKSVGLQYLEAVRKMMLSGVRLKRTIHIAVVPDGETGGSRGIAPFIQTNAFKALNVGFAMDEGLTSPNATLYAIYLDKRTWQYEVTIKGPGGHASTMPDQDITHRFQTFFNATMSYRSEQLQLKKSRPLTDYGAYDSVQVTIIKGGFGTNVIPSRITTVVDMRLSVNTSVTDVQSRINSWIAPLGNNTEIKYIRKVTSAKPTSVGENNQYWVAMKSAVNNLGIPLVPIVAPFTTDMSPIRDLGIPAIGFSPIRLTANRIHENDEYINIHTYLQGIDVFVAILNRVGNV